MHRGKITLIERPKGYGFIESDVGDRVFFHQRWLRKMKFRDLDVGSEVTFAINQGPRGLRAYNIALATDEGDDKYKARPIEKLFKD